MGLAGGRSKKAVVVRERLSSAALGLVVGVLFLSAALPGVASPAAAHLRPAASPVPPAAVLPYGEWTNATPSGNPGPVVWGSMAYSPDADRVLLVSGAASVTGQTWLYDPGANAWTMVPAGTAFPGARTASSLVYDPAVRKFVLFGGYQPYQSTPVLGGNDTWLFDPASNTWANVSPRVSPSTRFGQGMAFDPAIGKVVMFGGQHETYYPPTGGSFSWVVNDTWVYDAAANTWTNVTTSAAPLWNASPYLWWDPAFGTVLLLNQVPGETWRFDAATGAWQKLANQTGPFDDRPAIAYDNATRSVVVFSGGFLSLGNDTWWFNATQQTWTKAPSRDAPAPRYGAMAAYDSKTGQLILYGGRDFGTTFTDTWLYRPIPPPPLLATITVATATGAAPFLASFQGQARGGFPPYAYHWNFSDGTLGTGQTMGHVFKSPGTYAVRLTVTDALGNATIASVDIRVGPMAPATFAVPLSVGFAASIGIAVVAAASAAVATYILLRPRRSPPRGP